jgi:inorganic pyrophosphatase
MDRPIGSYHPKFKYEYPVNYGYIPRTRSGDGEELDAYVLGVNEPLDSFQGVCIAIIKRLTDNDDKLIVVPQGIELPNRQIYDYINFQEQFF